jgi:hypothetical protein
MLRGPKYEIGMMSPAFSLMKVLGLTAWACKHPSLGLYFPEKISDEGAKAYSFVYDFQNRIK